MARRNPEPIITQTEILAMAGRQIQQEIIAKRREVDQLAELAESDAQKQRIAELREMTEEQLVNYYFKRLEAIETMYQIQTGTELGLIAELG